MQGQSPHAGLRAEVFETAVFWQALQAARRTGACGHGMAYGAVPYAAALLSRRAACAPMPPHAGGAARRPAAAGADIPANFSGKNLPRVPHYVQKAHAFVQCIRQNDKF